MERNMKSASERAAEVGRRKRREKKSGGARLRLRCAVELPGRTSGRVGKTLDEKLCESFWAIEWQPAVGRKPLVRTLGSANFLRNDGTDGRLKAAGIEMQGSAQRYLRWFFRWAKNPLKRPLQRVGREIGKDEIVVRQLARQKARQSLSLCSRLWSARPLNCRLCLSLIPKGSVYTHLANLSAWLGSVC
ncbi:hypothetical protein HDV57DRAFT_312792 [Trichoderma longibrachiatum]